MSIFKGKYVLGESKTEIIDDNGKVIAIASNEEFAKELLLLVNTAKRIYEVRDFTESATDTIASLKSNVSKLEKEVAELEDSSTERILNGITMCEREYYVQQIMQIRLAKLSARA